MNVARRVLAATRGFLRGFLGITEADDERRPEPSCTHHDDCSPDRAAPSLARAALVERARHRASCC
ncbi:MAG TPA: hypothetical protein VGK20_16290 [Candidatus Binatia bacterium]